MGRSFRSNSPDAVVIGAGFGGLASALSLAERGARVVLLEQLNYPGGCASTFQRRGYRFESGATLFSGFEPHQLFGRWIDRYQLPVEVDFIDPLVELRAPGLALPIPRSRAVLIERLSALPGAPTENLHRFFAYQKKVADALWSLLDEPDLLPPFKVGALLRHATRLPAYGPILSAVGRSLTAILRRFGLQDFAPLRTYLDALCQITVQCSASEAEAPFALSTMDYYFRGTGHVRGGIGVLAQALASAIEDRGGEVEFSSRVQRLEPTGEGWRVHARSGTFETKRVIASLIPHAVQRLLGEDGPRATRLDRRAKSVEKGWGAAMLYLVAEAPPEASPYPVHLELVPDPSRPFVEGHHLFCSISGAEEDRGEPGMRTITVSTHVPMAKFRALADEEQGNYIADVQTRMRSGLESLAPEWWSRVKMEMTASPRTFQRFTGRPYGYVGGAPRRRGLGHYVDLIPQPVLPGLHLVGDSVFPGQSTLATALGGFKLAERLWPAGQERVLEGPGTRLLGETIDASR